MYIRMCVYSRFTLCIVIFSLVEQLSADIKVIQNAYRSHQQRKSQVVGHIIIP